VSSVDSRTGAVTLTDLYAALAHNHNSAYDAIGAASSAVSTHAGLGDPHPAYALESALGNSATRNVGTTAGTVAAGDDSRFGAADDRMAAYYGGVAISGDPQFFTVPGSFDNNAILFSRVWVPAGKAITGAYVAIRNGSTLTHNGVNFGNQIKIFDDAGSAVVGSTAVDETLWTVSGWRGGNLQATIAAGSGRFVYVLAWIRGFTGVGIVSPPSSNDSNGAFEAVGPSQSKRRGGYWLSQSSFPSTFDPTTIGSGTGFPPLVLLT
jgi:hypothetical protein